MTAEQIVAGCYYPSITGWLVVYRRSPPGKPGEWSDEIKVDALKFAALSTHEVEEADR